ncbi:uncharacterized protein LOC128989996 isoform X1 [Macrosteles quadrilineatus]|uniref:uncharacterized protein LOC128989996 isoform X1 n=1 Tax=Macrosteles quadrilineatus TaxID=74068 RepID=UPI0023E2E19F|nr:uncharacterized protein LOC128989996 isoform X1 [Macrosteles quadrilineatus]
MEELEGMERVYLPNSGGFAKKVSWCTGKVTFKEYFHKYAEKLYEIKPNSKTTTREIYNNLLGIQGEEISAWKQRVLLQTMNPRQFYTMPIDVSTNELIGNESKPSTSTEKSKPSTSTGKSKPSTSTGKSKPPTSTGKSKPSTLLEKSKPSTSTEAGKSGPTNDCKTSQKQKRPTKKVSKKFSHSTSRKKIGNLSNKKGRPKGSTSKSNVAKENENVVHKEISDHKKDNEPSSELGLVDVMLSLPSTSKGGLLKKTQENSNNQDTASISSSVISDEIDKNVSVFVDSNRSVATAIFLTPSDTSENQSQETIVSTNSYDSFMAPLPDAPRNVNNDDQIPTSSSFPGQENLPQETITSIKSCDSVASESAAPTNADSDYEIPTCSSFLGQRTISQETIPSIKSCDSVVSEPAALTNANNDYEIPTCPSIPGQEDDENISSKNKGLRRSARIRVKTEQIDYNEQEEDNDKSDMKQSNTENKKSNTENKKSNTQNKQSNTQNESDSNMDEQSSSDESEVDMQYKQRTTAEIIHEINQRAPSQNRKNCSIRGMTMVDTTQRYGKRNLLPREHFLVSFRVHKPFKHAPGLKNFRIGKCLQEIDVLNFQTLFNLRQKIMCELDYQTTDGEISEWPFDKKQNLAKDTYKSGMFYIDNTFYIDTVEGTEDYSEPIKKWAQENHIDVGKTMAMHDRKVEDLRVRFGYPYVYIHQGSCEHIIMISQARFITEKHSLHSSDYPNITKTSRSSISYCLICTKKPADRIVMGSDRMPHDVNLMCQDCFISYHYVGTQKICRFKAYKWNQRALLFN